MLFATDQFIAPAYGGGCFADIPAFLQAAIAGGPAPLLQPDGWARLPARYDRLVVFFLDAFGWRFHTRFQEHPFLQRFARQGSVTQLTAQFPSTTSAHVTTLYTGQPVGRHGILEWFYYEPAIDAVIAPLLFSYAGDKARETLRTAGVEATTILPPGLFAGTLAAAGVSTLVFQPREFAFSTYSRTMTAGAQLVGYRTLPEALANLTLSLARMPAPSCHVVYAGNFDEICHHYGPDTPQSDAELEATLDLLERWFVRDIQGRCDNTLVALFADHGQVHAHPSKTLYINNVPAFRQLRPLLRTDQGGALLAPGGSCRDFFVYAQEAHIAEAQAILTEMVTGRAEVKRVAELVQAGFFGPLPVTPLFAARAGNLVVLPYAGEGVYWYEKGRFEQEFWGHHGGLTRAEMEIPFLLLPV